MKIYPEYILCKICKIEKIHSFFYFRDNGAKLDQYKCKQCVAKSAKEYMLASDKREHKKEYDKIYHQKNKEKRNAQSNQYEIDHKEDMQRYRKKYNIEKKVEIRVRKQIYTDTHKEEKRLYDIKYRKIRSENDPVYKLKKVVSWHVSNVLKQNNSSKNGNSCLDYFVFTIPQLKKYLENLFLHQDNLTSDGRVWMTWKNRGVYNAKTWNDDDCNTWKWQLDHIIPQSDLPYTSMEDENFKKCWALENLRPLSAKQNILDGVKRVRHNKGSK